jgi:hypothetical protein
MHRGMASSWQLIVTNSHTAAGGTASPTTLDLDTLCGFLLVQLLACHAEEAQPNFANASCHAHVLMSIPVDWQLVVTAVMQLSAVPSP